MRRAASFRSTLVAAIISKAAVKGALFAVMSFPLLMLPLMMLVGASDTVLQGQGISEILEPIQENTDHRPSVNRMKHFGEVGFHPLALPRR